MRHDSTTIARRLDLANTILTTTSNNSEIRELVAARGYSELALAEGRQLYDAALRAVDEQATRIGARQRATLHAARAEQAARTAYQDLVKTARVLFPSETPEWAELDIKPVIPRDNVQFVATAMTLFNNALRLDRIGLALAQYGFHQAALEHGRSLIVTYQQALQEQLAAKRSAMQATSDLHTAITALHQWLMRYLTVARIALRGRPDLLVCFGLDRKRARQKRSKKQTAETKTQSQPAVEAQG
jgi:hypothetical protein